ncbi:MAG: TTAGGG repeat binding factor [Candelina mexicana]|nr:MAG: TTAGGG repeat binding factor [Candelina mexicana]
MRTRRSAIAAESTPEVTPAKSERHVPSVEVSEPQETIGSRLRKRRRTGSTAAEAMPTAKRLSSERDLNGSTVPGPSNEMPTPSDQLLNEQHSASPVQNGDDVHMEDDPESQEQQEDLEDQGEPEELGEEEVEEQEEEVYGDMVEEDQPDEGQISEQVIWAAALANRIGLGPPVDELIGVQGGTDYDHVLDLLSNDNWLSVDASLQLKVQSLPILDNLSTQILNTLAKGSHKDTLMIVTEPESDRGQAYLQLKSLFDHTKKVYSSQEPFLSAFDLKLHEPAHFDTIRKANLTTFVSSVFGSQDVGFYHLNEYFLDTFVPDGGRLLKSQAGLFLELKTQAYISAMSNGERSREEILEDLFPEDLEERLLARRLGAKALAPSEADFVKRARSRRDHLLAEPDNDAMATLPDKYVWEDFLRDVTTYVSKNFDAIVTPLYDQQARRGPRGRPSVYSTGDFQAEDMQSQNGINDQQPEVLNEHNRTQEQEASHQDIVEKAARAAQIALQGEFFGGPQEEPQLQQQHYQPQEHYQQPPQQDQEQQQRLEFVHNSVDNFGHPAADVPTIPYHTQTAPTQVLYERARQAATAKASPSNRRAGLPSQRRPWTTEEENALMAGLDRVKGPHWSQILAMFGPGGTINESLKDRNQVQLKDKARNLKLFFLKSGIEVPYYLQFVTGELKTRAPAQAAKNEARERARQRGDEDRAHVEGILALAGGARPEEPNGDSSGQVNGHDHGVVEAEEGAMIALAPPPELQGQTLEPQLNYEQALAKSLLEQAE